MVGNREHEMFLIAPDSGLPSAIVTLLAALVYEGATVSTEVVLEAGENFQQLADNDSQVPAGHRGYRLVSSEPFPALGELNRVLKTSGVKKPA